MKKVAVGVDIGGTNSVYGLVDEAGEIICEGAFPTRNYPDFDQYIEELYIGIQDLLKRAGDEVELVGIERQLLYRHDRVRTEPRLEGRAEYRRKDEALFPHRSGHHHQRRECGSRR